MSIEALKQHHNNLGIAIAKIDTEVSDNGNIPVEELIRKFKKRSDLVDVHGYISYLGSLGKQSGEASGESKIVQLPNKIIAP